MPSRLTGWDYSANGAYFVTICTYRRARVLGSVQSDGVAMSPLGTLVARHLHDVTGMRAGVQLDCWVVMPDHVHFIVLLSKEGCLQVSAMSLVGELKAKVTLIARRTAIVAPDQPLWQRSFYDRVIRNLKELDELRAYIEHNPRRWWCRGAE